VVLVDKDEAMYVRQHCSDDFTITRTMIQKSDRHRYYMPETQYALDLLQKYRSERVTEHFE
jgi:hypothetical protein